MIQLISNQTSENGGLSIVTRGKAKDVFYSNWTRKINAQSLVMCRENMKTGNIKEVRLNQKQADVHIHQQVARSLKIQPCPTMRPYTSMVGLPAKFKHLKEKDILIRFAVPGVFDVPDVEATECLKGIEAREFYPFENNGTVKFAILTVYPKDSGYFATLKSNAGYLGLPMTHWMSLVPLWEKTTVKTEIAVLIDSEGLPYNRFCTQDSNRSIITPLGIISGFYTGNSESYDHLSERSALLELTVFESACTPSPYMDGTFGYEYCPQMFKITSVDPRRSLLMEILEFDSSTNEWLIGFSDTRVPLFSIPYIYSDFYSKGYQVAVVTTVCSGNVDQLLSSQFHSSSLEDDSTSLQLSK